jgi:hypothetical protein
VASAPKLEATAPSAVADQGDQSLPDATSGAKLVLVALLLLGVVLSIVANAAGWTAQPFDPAKAKSAEFGLFAGFYVAAQVIERLMELVAPFLPWPGWKAPKNELEAKDKATVASAYLKADRAVVALGVTTLLGILASFLFGLYFLQSIGISASNTVDVFVSGLTIGAGTKPLHDLISSLQNKNTPTTGTKTNAE